MTSIEDLIDLMKGEDGTSVVDAFINRKGIKKYVDSVPEGHLLIETDDGELIDAGMVKGEKGDKGDTPIKGKDYFDGKDYIITEADRKKIASEIQVPIVEKVIERTEVVKEQPIVTNEIKEVAKYETPKEIKDKLEKLKGDDRLDAKAIKNLPTQKIVRGGTEQLSQLVDVKLQGLEDGQIIKYNKSKGQRENKDDTGSGSSITLKTNGTNNGSQSILDLKAGTNVTLTDDGVGGVTIESSGGGAVDSVNGQTGVVVLDTDDIADTATNRYTSDTEIAKLAGIEAGAQVNTVTPTNTVTLTNKTLTEPKFADDGFIADANGNEMVSFNSNASAVNYLEIENGAAGNPPHLRAMGNDTNIGLHLVGKGTGEVSVCDAVDETKRLRFGISNNGTGIITTLRSNSTSSSKTIDLPNASGTIALTSDLTNFVTTTQAQNGADKWAVTGGVANTYTLTLSPAITSYATGQTFHVQFHAANTGASTINVNGLGAKSLVKDVSTALVSGDIPINQIYTITYDGTNFLVRDIGFAGINTSARLAGCLSDETGTGVAVFGTSPTFTTSVVGGATFAAFNTVTTNLSLGGAATTMTIGGTPKTAITHTYSGNATATATTKTVNLGTGGAAGSTTNINIGSANGGTTTVNSPNTSLGGITGATTTGTIELGHASDTTISRVRAGQIAVEGVNVGYLEIPQNSQSAAYTLVLADSGKHIYHPSADTTARTWTIPANSSVAYPIGTSITFVNDTSAGAITIDITTDTLVLAGAGTTGSRTLAANGVATAIKVTSTRWMISGTNLT